MAYDADLASTHNPSVGGTPTAAWGDKINDNFATLGGAWTAFTPTWTASGSNPAIGNGSLSGAYMQAGKMLHVRYWIKAGTTTTFGTGGWFLTLPNSLTVSTSYTQTITAYAYDSSTTTMYTGVAFIGSLGAQTAKLLVRTDSGTDNVQSNLPFTWATSDELSVEGVLEVA